MAQDFAKRKPSTGSKKAPARRTQAQRHTGDAQPRGKGLRLYLTGVVTGVFLSFLLYLGTLPKSVDPGQELAGATPAEAAAEIPKPRFEFYTMLPEQTMEVEPQPDAVEPAAVVPKPQTATAAPQPYFLQAGSFRQRDDAERRRAELLLLGLEPKIEESNGDTGRWFRVSLGPFDSHESTAQARGLLANQNIDSVLLRRSGP
ncbi:MAG: SPOR domain-containing protein [Halioglobus sp.]